MTIKDNILNALALAGMNPITAQFAFAQAAHETGNFTSPLFFTNNNCFGMKMPTKRNTTADREQLGYAHYKTYQDSASDFAIYYKYVALSEGLQTIDQFITGLYNKNYFEDTLENYLAGVKHFYNMYFNV